MKTKDNKKQKQSTGIKKILVPIDFSECGSNALRHAIFLAKTFMAKLELMHVVSPFYAYSDITIIQNHDAFYKSIATQSEKQLKKIASEIKKDEAVDVSIKCSIGVVHELILEYAKKTKTDLIVMGTHGVSGVKEFFAGSNAYRVVSESKCPVITIQKRILKKGFKTIVLPVRTEMNSRQKVGIVSMLSKHLFSKVLITGYTDGSDKKEEIKVKKYMTQIQVLLKKESINSQLSFIKDDNFTKAIINHSKKNKADLIAVMTNHDFSLDQLLSGPYAQQLVNHSKIPILSVPDTLEFEYAYSSPSAGYVPS